MYSHESIIFFMSHFTHIMLKSDRYFVHIVFLLLLFLRFWFLCSSRYNLEFFQVLDKYLHEFYCVCLKFTD